jgi:N-acetylglucosaminyl-diphospho-decaprenol L-rhamnosyltransferase
MSADPKVVCILVHHRHFPAVLDTVEALLQGGIGAADLIVVDNSEDEHLQKSLRTALPPSVQLVIARNAGYGSAVNAGIRASQLSNMRPEFLLVSTHETVPTHAAVKMLVDAMEGNPEAGVAGPTLVHSPSGGRVWSMGGGIGRLTGMPFHLRNTSRRPSRSRPADSRDWLDGAFCLYRAGVLEELLFREDFVMYFEEVDLHRRIRAAGRDVLWVSDAVVSQASSGVPPYLLARNLQIFLSTHGRLWQRIVGAPHAALRHMLRHAGQTGRRHRAADLASGWWAGLRHGAELPGASYAEAEKVLARSSRGTR